MQQKRRKTEATWHMQNYVKTVKETKDNEEKLFSSNRNGKTEKDNSANIIQNRKQHFCPHSAKI